MLMSLPMLRVVVGTSVDRLFVSADVSTNVERSSSASVDRLLVSADVSTDAEGSSRHLCR